MLLLCLFIQTSCGRPEVPKNMPETTGNRDENNLAQNSPTEDHTVQLPEESDSAAPSEEAENDIILHSDWLTSTGTVDQTWTKNYDNAEWEDTPCLYLYTHWPTTDDSITLEIENELNHRLFLMGHDFHVRFLPCYVESQEALYQHFNESVWEQLRSENGQIYGIPTDPIAAGKLGYVYNPQLASLLSIDMSGFSGDLSVLEPYFSAMLEEGITPLILDLMPKDYLLLSLAGLETYGDIFAIRHDAAGWKAVDLWQEKEMTSIYQKPGSFRENGYLFYHENILLSFDLKGTPVDSEPYRYRFLQLQSNDKISWFYDVNMSDEGSFLETNFFIPDQPAYIYEKMNDGIMVINNQTDYPEECMEFLRLLTLDKELRLLLYSGILGADRRYQCGKIMKWNILLMASI